MNNTFNSSTNRLLVSLIVLLGSGSVSFAQEYSPSFAMIVDPALQEHYLFSENSREMEGDFIKSRTPESGGLTATSGATLNGLRGDNSTTEPYDVTSPGTIEGDEESCGPYDPRVISSITPGQGVDCGNVVVEDLCANDERVFSLTFRYTGESCSGTNGVYADRTDKYSCHDYNGGPNGDTQVYIVANDDDNDLNNAEFTGIVNLNGEFTITASGADLPNPTWIHVLSQQGGTELQLLEFHTSCSAPVVTGEQIGSLLLLAATDNTGFSVGAPAGVDYQWQSQPVAGGSWTNISGATGETYDPPFLSVSTRFRRVAICAADGDQQNSNVVTKLIEPIDAGEVGGDESNCGAFDPALITSIVDAEGECSRFEFTGEDCCENGGDKPVSFVLQYVGGDCSDSNNTQGPIGGKWDCDLGAANNSSVYIVVASGQFSGVVNLNSNFTVTNGGARLENPIEVSIYSSQGGNLLQYLEIHTSCSAPITNGDQFGALVLLSSEYENGFTCGTVTTGLSYQWQFRRGTTGMFQNITGATGTTYDPPFITETTQYQRLVDCGDCGSEISNIVTKEVLVLPESEIIAAPATLCEGENGSFGAATCNATIVNQDNFTYSSRIVASADDSWQDGYKNHPFDDEYGRGVNPEIHGFRFVNLNIPAGATITGANLTLTGRKGSAATITLKAVRQAAPPSYTSTDYHLSDLYDQNSTTSSQSWSISQPTDGVPFTSPDFSNVLQELVNSFGGITHVSLLLNDVNNDNFNVWNFDDGLSNINKRPMLNVTYSINSEAESQVSCNYQWSFPGGTPSTSTEQFPNVTWDTPGVKTVTLTVDSGSAACSSTYTTTTTVLVNPSVTVAADNTTCGQNNGSITFTFSDEPSRTNIEFSIDGGETFLPSVPDNSGSTTVDNLPAGTYDLRARWGNDECQVELPSVVIINDAGPTVNAGADQMICGGESVNLLASASGGTGTLTYTWSNGLGSGASKTVSPASTTTYTVTVTDVNNCSDEASVTVTIKPQPLAEINATTTEICSDESVTFTATTSVAGTIYSWNFGENASPATATGVGPHVVTYTIPADQDEDVTPTATLTVSLNGCIDEDSATITVRDLPEPSITASTDPTTCGGSDGTVAVSVVRPFGVDVEVSLDGGATYQICNQTTFSGLPAGTYSIVARYCDNFCPVNGGSITLNDPEPPVAEINGPAEVCNENDNSGVEVVFTATDAGAEATYAWNFGTDATPQTATGLNPGPVTYSSNGARSVSLTVTLNGCTDTDEFTITVTEAPVVTVTDVMVCEEDNATLTAITSGGVGPYTFAWSDGGGTGPSATYTQTVGTTTYSVTVTDANGCSSVGMGSVTVNPLPVPDLSDDLSICTGESTTLVVEGVLFGTPPFTYRWWNGNDPATTLSTGTELTVGPNDLVEGNNNFIVRVMDVNGCFERDIVMVTVVPVPEVTVAPETICFGETATLVAQASGGNGTFAYEWSTGATTASIDVTPNTTTDYSVTVTSTYTSSDDGITNCTAEATSTVTVTPLPVAEINGDAPVCSEESLTFTATDAGAGSSYVWNFGANASPATATGAGPHSVTYTLPANPAGNGTATVSLTVTKDNCVETDEATITIYDLPEATVSSTNPTCGEDNGTITVTFPNNPSRTGIQFSINGAAGPYVQVNDNTGSYTFTGLGAGSYDLYTRWGNEQCPVDLGPVTLTDENGPDVTAAGATTICVGGSVTLSATATGGAAPITYAWNQGAGAGASVVVTPTETTTYTVTATDANGCEDTDQVTVTVVPDPQVTIVADGTDICEGGVVTLTATPSDGLDCDQVRFQGREAGTTIWGPAGTGTITQIGPGLPPGVYEYRAVYECSGEGCDDADSDVVTVTITPDPEITISLDDDFLCIGESATFTATVSGGLDCENVTWHLRSGAQAYQQVASGNSYPVPTNLVAGTYTVRAEYACGGEGCDDATSNEVSFTVKPSPVANVEDITICAGESGTLTVTTSAGEAPFTYVWSDGGGTDATATYGPLTTDATYTVVVTDANGCTTSATGTINVTPLPAAAITPLPGNECDGTEYEFVAADAGVGAVYSWNFGAFATPATATGPGPHTVVYTTADAATVNNTTVTLTVTKDNCVNEDTEDVTVLPIPTIDVSAGDPSTCQGTDGTLGINVTSVDAGGALVELSIDGGLTYSTCGNEVFTGLSAGTYTIYARYCNDDCPYELETVTLTDPLSPTAEINGPTEVCEEDSNTGTEAVFTATNAGPLTTYSWNFGAGASPQTATGRTPGPVTYATPGNKAVTLTVTRLGCSDSDVFTLTVNEAPTVTVAPVNICAEEDATLTATATGGEAPYTYAWSGGGGNLPSATYEMVMATTNYSVTVTDANGCSTVATGTVNVNPLPVPDLSDDLTICDGESTTLIVENVFFGTAPFTYQWWNGNDPATILSTTTELTVGPADLVMGVNNFFVRVTDANGCFERDVVMVTVVPAPEVVVAPQVICVDETVTLFAEASGGNSIFTYQWSANANNATTASVDVSPVVTTTYSVTVTSTYTTADGGVTNCTDVTEVTVTVTEKPQVDITVTGDENNNNRICEGQEITLTATATLGTAPYTILWTTDTDPAFSSSSEMITVSPTETTVYTVKVTDANGCMDTDNVTITPDPNECASLGDYVWEDTNGNGINDEPVTAAVNNVTVNLLDENGTVIDVTTTGINPDNGLGGFYEFTGLTPGTYSVQFVLPTNTTFTTLNAIGSNETNDSDADPNDNGKTDQVTLVSGQHYPDLDAGIQRVPSMEVEKAFVSAVLQPNGTFDVTYTVDVINTGGIGSYTLIDTPNFDDDITINSGAYSGEAAGALNVGGATTLTSNNLIAADATETFTLVYNVTLDLRTGSVDNGDNIYTECGRSGSTPGVAGEGLFNLVELDVNNDGSIDDSDTACGDLPNVVHEKSFVSATLQPDGTYEVTYNVIVTNNGGANGIYGLDDTPLFDDAVTINSGSFTADNGLSGPLVDATNLLAAGQSLAGGASDVYTLTFNVSLDAAAAAGTDGSAGYVDCESGNAGNSPDSDRFALYNVSGLDANADGTPDSYDDACGDLPVISHEKVAGGVIQNADGTYTVTYTVTVTNSGSVAGTYGLDDTPLFDAAVTINSGSFTADNGLSGPLVDATNLLAAGQGLAGGTSDVYTLTFNVSLDAAAAAGTDGSAGYVDCESGNAGNSPDSDRFALYNVSGLDTNADGTPDSYDDACGDLPVISHEKVAGGVIQNADGTYTVTYTVTVTNSGSVAGTYGLDDTPLFDAAVTINSGSFTADNGLSGPLVDATNLLAAGQGLAGGATDVYTLTFNVSLDAAAAAGTDGSAGYVDCESGNAGNGPDSDRFALYNVSGLDANDDGTPDSYDDACEDLPVISHEKVAGGVTQNADGTYTVTYTVTVTNSGSVAGTYGLDDTPLFDAAVTINSGSFTADNGLSGPLVDATNLLAAGQSLAGGTSDVYSLTFNVSVDAAAAAGTDGSAGYVDCESGNAGNSPDSDRFALYNVSGLDANDDGTPDSYDDACEDLPVISHEKVAGDVTQNADGTYTVTYTVTVTNSGSVAGTYGLDDTPLFDAAVTINSGSFTADNGLSGPLVDATNLLAAGQGLAGGTSDVYTLTFNVSLDAAAAAGTDGSAGYVDCESGNAGNSPDSDRFALYNVSGLDANADGTPDSYDDACEDLPVISHEKVAGGVIQNADGTYTVTYTVTVTNSGSVAGTYGLDDKPLFDAAVTINSGSFTADNGLSGPLVDATNLLAAGQGLAGGASDVYTLTFNVSLDAAAAAGTDGSAGYVDCESGNAGNSPDSDRFALYNVSGLDANDDGTPDSYDDACEDLPVISHEKVAGGVIQNADGTYTVTYTVTVTNSGSVAGTYGLDDTPLFDAAVTINSGSFTADNGLSGPLVDATNLLAAGQGLAGGASDVYTLTFNVSVDAAAAAGTDGSAGYVDCESGNAGNSPDSDRFALYNVSGLDANDDGTPDSYDDACEDLPVISHEKVAGGVTQNADGTYTVTYTVTVTNSGSVAGTYGLDDTPLFDAAVTINSGSFTADNGLSGTLVDATNLLAAGQGLAGGASDVYSLTFNVSVDAAAAAGTDGSAGYVDCESGNAGNGPDSDRFALYNVSGLDANDDGTPDSYDDACEDLPVISHEKVAGGVTQNADGTYTVTYTVTVTNSGSVAGTYGLDDTPLFDAAVTINSGSFTADNGLSGPLVDATNLLAAGQSLAGGASDVYTLTFNVSLDAAAAAGTDGSAGYVDCESGNAGNSPDSDRFALYNVSGLDANDDGTPDSYDDACEDLPVISHEKSFVSVTPNLNDGTYSVVYTVRVTNDGQVAGTYGLDDTPLFDDDITINSGTFSVNGIGVNALMTSGTSILATPGTTLAAGGTDVYELTFIVTIDLNVLSTDNGDNAYVDCETGDAGNTPDSDRFALYNVSGLDLSGDGVPESFDDDCGDLPLFDLALDKNLVPAAAPYTQGSAVTYTVTVTNEGEIAAADVEVTDTPEAGLLFSSINPQAGITGTGNGSFTIAALPVGGSVTVTLNYTIDAGFQGTTLNNAAEITEDGPFDDIDSDPETGPDTDEDGDGDGDDDDEDNVDLTLEQTFDLALRKTTISAGPYTQGSTVTYQLEVINQGSIDATNVELTDYIPTGLNLTDGAWSQTGSLATRTIAGPIAANGGTATVTISFQIATTFQGTTINNFAEISSSDNALDLDDVDSPEDQDNTDDPGGQPNSPADDFVDGDGTGTPGDGVAATDEDNHDGAQIEVGQLYDLALTKDLLSANSNPIVQGTELTYTITVTNEGSLNAANVEVTDTPDANLSYVGENLPAGITGTNGVYVIASLAQGATVSFEVTYAISPTFQGTSVTNDAQITLDDGDDVDSNPETGDDVDEDGDGDGDDDDEDSVTTPVNQTPSIDIEKGTFDPVLMTFVDADEYNIAVSPIYLVPRVGTGVAPTVQWEYVVTNTGTLDLVNVEVTDDIEGFVGIIPSLAVGQTVTLTLSAPATVGIYRNLSTATGQPVDENGDPIQDEVSDEDPSTYRGILFNIAKIADNEVICEGEEVTYTLTVRLGENAQREGAYGTMIDVQDNMRPNVLDDFIEASDLNSNDTLDFDFDTDEEEEWVYQYTIRLTETRENIVMDVFNIYIRVPGAPDRFAGIAMASDTVTVTVNPNPIVNVADTNPDGSIICNGLEDGSATVTITGNGGPYSILWDAAAGNQTTATATGLGAGTYQVIVTDDITGCADTAMVTLEEPEILTLTGEATDVECNGAATGSIDITVGGGTPGYTYSWSGTGVVVADEDQSGLTAGIYSVTVTDANGCMIDETFEIEESTDLDATVADTDVLCNGDANGTLTVVVTGGTPDYTYAWNTTPVQSGATATGLTAGTYTVMVTDANGCTEVATGTVNEPTALMLNGTTVDVECNGAATGSIDITVGGGTPGYTYSWSGTGVVVADEDQSGLTAGIYSVTVTDANGCMIDETFEIEESTDLEATVADTDVLCNGDDNGTLTVVVTGGTPDYTYVWNTTPAQTGATVTGLVAGTYTVTVTDANGCTEVAMGTVNEPEDLVIDETVTELDCNEVTGASIDLTVTGGTTDYSFAWTGPGVAPTSEDQTNLGAGTYTVEVTDANNCIATETYVIAPASALEASIENDTICPNTDQLGSLTVVATLGDGNYTYQWDDATGGQTEATATGLAAGTYTVTVTDNDSDCSIEVTGEVIEDTGACASLGDYVWLDADEDGVQDDDEEGVFGVTVNLKDAAGNVIATTTTNEEGFYIFENLAPGTYSVQFVLPNEFLWTTLGAVAGANEDVDSDADPAMMGMTEQVTIVAGEFYGDLDAGLVPEVVCDLTAVVTVPPVCNDNGTPANSTDDFYTLTILVSGISPSGEWISGTQDINGNTISGTVGVPVEITLPAHTGADPIPTLTIIVSDAEDVSCTTSVNHTPLRDCSDRCRITASNSNSPICHDNGTAADPSDDFFTLGITARGINEFGASWTVSTMGGRLVGGGAYGQEDSDVGPFTLDDLVEGILRLRVQDDNDPSCIFIVSITVDPNTLPCSNSCTITIVQLGESICDDNGTPTISSDDQWWVQTQVSGTNLTRWTSTTPGGEGPNSLGIANFGFFTNPISGTQTITVTSLNVDPACTATIQVTAPGETCSDECDITAELTVGDCNDNGTADPLDDFFFVTVIANSVGENNSPNGWILIEGDDRTDPVVGEGPLFGRSYTFGPFLIHNEDGTVRGTQDYRVEDADDFYCRVDFDNVVLPEPCSEMEECMLEVEILNTTCDNNGTPTNGNDDTYSFEVLATGSTGGYTIRYTAPAGRADERGTFGQIMTYSGFDVTGSVSASIIPDDENCMEIASLFVQKTGECVDCSLEVEELSNVCDDNGTADPSDDTFTVTVAVRHEGIGNFFMVDVPGEGMVIGQYGTADTIQTFEFLVSDGDQTLIFIDMQNQEQCRDLITFLAPTESCGECEINAADLVTTECDQNDTPLDGSDDFFTATFTVTGFNTGTNGWVTTDGAYSGTYGEAITLTLPTGTDDLTLNIVDADDASCATDLMIEVPESCAEEPECEISVEVVSASRCNDDGGYEFDVTVTNSGAASENGWITIDGEYSGAYGETVTVSVDDVCGEAEFTFRDASNAECAQTITGRAPEVGIEAPADTDMVNDRDLICADFNEIFNLEGSLDLTGSATVTGCGEITVDFNDTFISGGPDATEGCDETVIRRIFTASICDGTMVADTQLITIRKPLVSDVIFPTDTIDFDCEGEGFPTDANGNPATSATGIPAIVTAFGDTTRFDDEFCGTLNVSYSDVVEQTCSGTQTIRRTWTATDECSNDVLTSEQIIRTGDFSPPIVSCPISNHYCPVIEEDIMLFPMDYFDCVANFTAPLPDVTDACSDSWTIVTYVVDSFGLGDTILVIEADDNRDLTLGAGDYVFRYTVTDDCGNVGTTDCRFRVADTQEPAAICISDINVSVGGYGIARIYGQMIDLGSYDNCGIDSILVRRELLIDPITGDSLAVPIWSDWGRWAEVVCEDAGTVVTLQLRVVDFGGNANICTTNAAVVDNTLPYCTGLEDLFLTCDEIPFDLDANDTLSLQAVFGRPVVIDNCSAESIELTPIVDYDACSESGTIIRRWLAIDAIGNVSAQEFTQRITITSDMGFIMVLPKDTLTDCLDANQGFEILGAGCADVSITFQDTIVEAIAADGDACLVIERKYIIINNCIFDPETDSLMVISRDEDCDGAEGESVLYAIVSGDSTYVDVDTSFNNAIPAAGTRGDECDGETNLAGRLRAFASTGGWTYTQRIAIFDDTNPVLNYEVPPIFCASEEDNCETVIEIPITISGECTAAGSNWLVMIDLGRDGNPEMRLQSDLVVQGTFPNYFIKAAIPLGQHNLIIRYVDGCNNAVSAAIPFEIVDCTIPDPICYSGLIANLETLETPVVDAEGNEITVGAIVDAGRLASCNVEDCNGPLRYSVNRIGDVPNVDSTDIVLTCEDRYRVELEVYMWDSAFNPFAVQPDGTLGGPNWKMCIVEVLVQDPNTLCDDCNADGSLVLGGSITTSQGVVLPNVEVDMNGDMTGFQLTGDDGKYTFPGVPAGDYSITPYKEDVAANGVSTLDELILQRHLLGVQLITDPLVLMAADLNNSGTLTVIDRLLMRNIILGNTEVLPGNETWRFVPVSYFEEGGDELERVMEAPRNITLTNVDACALGNDFYAIKMGDLNHSVFIQSTNGNILNGTRGRSSNETQQLEIEERRLQGGDLFDLPVRAADLEKISGMQFTLGFAEEALKIEEVVPGLLNEDQLGLRLVERGYISANWTQPQEMVGGGAVLFTVRLRGLRPGVISDAVRFVDNPTFTEAYSLGEEALMDLVLNVTNVSVPNDQEVLIGSPELEAVTELELSQNFPNPFRGETTISFKLPEAGNARLNVYDLSGRVLRDISGEFVAGSNTIKLQGKNLPSGTMVYTLTFKGQRLSRTMIHVF